MRVCGWSLGVTLSTAACLHAQAPAPTVAFAEEHRALLLAPGVEGSLRVSVTPARAGVAVWIVAPASAPLTFSGAAPNPYQIRLTTAEDGTASARFTIGTTPAAFLVAAQLESNYAAAHAAFTVTSAPTPSASPVAVRQAIVSGLERPLTARAELIGPFLLEAGTRVRPAGPDTIEKRLSIRTVEAPTWFAWIDENPQARYEHSTRYLFLDATAASPTLTGRPVDESWWPLLLHVSARPTSLRTPLETNAAPVPREEEAIALARRLRLTVEVEPDACAILIHGGDEINLRNDQRRARRFFIGDKEIPAEHVLEDLDADGNIRASTPDRIQQMIEQAGTFGCKRVYLYLTGHGGSGFFCAANPDTSEGAYPYEYVNYRDLRDWLNPLGNAGTEVVTIIDACNSGSAISPFHNSDVPGALLAAAGDGDTTGSLPGAGGYYTATLFNCWQDSDSDLNGDGFVDYLEAARCASSGLLVSNTAIFTTLDGQYGQLPTNNILIDLTSDPERTIVIPRPSSAVGDLNYTVSIEESDSAVAELGGTTLVRGVLRAGDTGPIVIRVRGKNPGTVPYKVSLRDDQQKRWEGGGSIIVATRYSLSAGSFSTGVGQSTTIDFQRSAEAAARDMTFTVEPATPGDARYVGLPSTFTVRAGERFGSFPIQGLRAGRAEVRITDQDGVSFRASVQVNGYFFQPDPVTLFVTDTVRLNLNRLGRSGKVVPITIRPRGPADEQLATVASLNPVFGADNDSLQLSVNGVRPGTAVYQFNDPDTGALCEVTIHVLERPAINGLTTSGAPPFFEVDRTFLIDFGFPAGGAPSPYYPVDIGPNTGVRDVVVENDLIYLPVILRPQSKEGRAATPIPAGERRRVYTNARGFLTLRLTAAATGTATINFEIQGQGRIPFTFPVVSPLAPLPDELLITPPLATPVGSTVTMIFTARRNGLPLPDAVITVGSASTTSANAEFTTGTLFRRNFATQTRTAADGRTSVQFRPLVNGPIKLEVVAGQIVRQVTLTATGGPAPVPTRIDFVDPPYSVVQGIETTLKIRVLATENPVPNQRVTIRATTGQISVAGQTGPEYTVTTNASGEGELRIRATDSARIELLATLPGTAVSTRLPIFPSRP